MFEEWQFWFAGAGLLITIITCTVKIVDKIGITNAAVVDLIAKRKEEVDATIVQLRKDVWAELGKFRREFIVADDDVRKAVAEVGNATRGKLQQVELYVRDEYVSKADYREDLTTLMKIVDALGDRIEKRLQSFENKLDELQRFNMASIQGRRQHDVSHG